ncbi:hypothetical protein KUTeg_020344 [Tegillarca granosa]|uniref:Uncharacterized protein n=1 Tax=Tegillarca granosa TaxID=220873 RepID=A0ABQ9E7S1_TEGGR|nr:hypothetical protein KUTeg_020344 [Tegillarca granosa]
MQRNNPEKTAVLSHRRNPFTDKQTNMERCAAQRKITQGELIRYTLINNIRSKHYYFKIISTFLSKLVNNVGDFKKFYMQNSIGSIVYGDCWNGWIRYSNSCYLFTNAHADWHEAQENFTYKSAHSIFF